MSTTPDLRDGVVHLWRAGLDAAAPDDLSSSLSPDERRRALSIVDPLRRDRWTRSRAVLRLLLGRYLRLEPREPELVSRAGGKLVLRAPVPLHFNLSHSGPLAVYAFSRSDEVGVDVEVPRGLSRERRRAWVRREAALKCSGEGILSTRAAARVGAREPWMHEFDLGDGVLAALALEHPPRELVCFDLVSIRDRLVVREREFSDVLGRAD